MDIIRFLRVYYENCHLFVYFRYYFIELHLKILHTLLPMSSKMWARYKIDPSIFKNYFRCFQKLLSAFSGITFYISKNWVVF